jgi:hypothetical protein
MQPANREEMPILVAQGGPLNGQRWDLKDVFILGRDVKCDITINDRQVSRQHARLVRTEEGMQVEDLGSKNGTHLNGQIIESAVTLQDGDIVQIALAQKFMFLSSDATLPLELQGIDWQNASQEPASDTPRRLRLDKRSHQVWLRLGHAPTYKEQEIIPPLSVSQFRMLEMLYENQGQVVSRRSLVEAVWSEKEAYNVSEQALDALIRRLRERIASFDPHHEYIVTVRGHGLRLDNPGL